MNSQKDEVDIYKGWVKEAFEDLMPILESKGLKVDRLKIISLI